MLQVVYLVSWELCSRHSLLMLPYVEAVQFVLSAIGGEWIWHSGLPSLELCCSFDFGYPSFRRWRGRSWHSHCCHDEVGIRNSRFAAVGSSQCVTRTGICPRGRAEERPTLCTPSAFTREPHEVRT